MKRVGIVGSIMGLIITIFGYFKYQSAYATYKAASYFGENDSSYGWLKRVGTYKIVIIIGAIILVVSLILLIASFISINENNQENSQSNTNNNYDRLSQLDTMKKDGLITEDEYNTKRKDIIDSM